MAHITKFRIEGLLGRDDPIEFSLNRDVNIFFGGNGCGKTTLLRILDAAMARNSIAMKDLPLQRADVWIFSLQHMRNIRHVWIKEPDSDSFDFVDTYGGDDDDFQFSEIDGNSEFDGDSDIDVDVDVEDAETLETGVWNIIDSPKLRGTAWKHIFLPTDRLLFEKDFLSAKNANSKIASNAALDRLFTRNITRSWLKVNSSMLESVNNIQQAALQQVLYDALGTSVKEEIGISDGIPEIYRRVCSFLSRPPISGSLRLGNESDFEQRYESEPELRRLVTKLNKVEREIEAAVAPMAAFEKTIKSLLSNGKSIQMKSDEIGVSLSNGKHIPISSLSSGEKHLVKILLDAISAESNTLIIDEPELSMHIDWQSRFCQAIKSINPDCQLILASHSPEIMADVDDSRIFKI